MKIRNASSYFVYITTNPRKTVLYTGVTNDLKRRMIEHFESRGNDSHFAGKYFCFKLLYYELYDTAIDAIQREKLIKDLSRELKVELIKSMNPKLDFLVVE